MPPAPQESDHLAPLYRNHQIELSVTVQIGNLTVGNPTYLSELRDERFRDVLEYTPTGIQKEMGPGHGSIISGHHPTQNRKVHQTVIVEVGRQYG